MPLIVKREQLIWPLSLWEPELSTCWIHLYKNPVDITDETELVDFIEADFAGYEPKPLSNWGMPFVDAENRGVIQHANVIWEHEPSGLNCDVYGYYVTRSSSTDLAWSEAMPDGPVYVGTPGQTLIVQPRLHLRNEA